MSIRRKIRHNLAYMAFLTILIACSAFFTYRVEAFRARTSKARLTATISSGTEVAVERVIDGDEISVRSAEDRSFLVRLLGIKSFEPGANDPDVGIFGRSAVAFLEQKLAGETARVEFEEFKTDRSGRLLAYVRLGDEDVGRSLIERGLTLVYTEYPFSREAEYLQVQTGARHANRGLWGTPKAAQRAEALFETWAAERKQ